MEPVGLGTPVYSNAIQLKKLRWLGDGLAVAGSAQRAPFRLLVERHLQPLLSGPQPCGSEPLAAVTLNGAWAKDFGAVLTNGFDTMLAAD